MLHLMDSQSLRVLRDLKRIFVDKICYGEYSKEMICILLFSLPLSLICSQEQRILGAIYYDIRADFADGASVV